MKLQAGMRFGRWTLLFQEPKGSGLSQQKMWVLQCDCGEYGKARKNCLTAGRSRSCGCLRKQFFQEFNKKRWEARCGRA